MEELLEINKYFHIIITLMSHYDFIQSTVDR